MNIKHKSKGIIFSTQSLITGYPLACYFPQFLPLSLAHATACKFLWPMCPAHKSLDFQRR